MFPSLIPKLFFNVFNRSALSTLTADDKRINDVELLKTTKLLGSCPPSTLFLTDNCFCLIFTWASTPLSKGKPKILGVAITLIHLIG